MMEQYFRIKESCRDCLLLFRLGDFYEMFGEDAVTGSKELGITLTSRDKGKKERVPLCGVPWHSLDTYLSKLIAKGYKVAICEQMEDPRTAKGLVDRAVVRIVTPGTVLESSGLDDRANSYLMAVSGGEGSYGVSFVDVSTGEFVTTQFEGEDAADKVLAEFAQRTPREVLHPTGAPEKELADEFVLAGAAMTELEDMAFVREASESLLKRHFGLKSLDGLGLADKPLAVASAGAVLRYLEVTQKRDLTFVSPPKVFSASDKLVLDQTTLRNLELVRNVKDGGKENTLMAVLDRTSTSMGSRLLRKWLLEPLMDVGAVNERLDAVEELVSNTPLRQELAGHLDGVRDLERMIGKVAYGSANPRDMVAIRSSLEVVPDIRELYAGVRSGLLRSTVSRMGGVDHLAKLIARSLVDDPPAVAKDGGVMRDGYDPQLDALRTAAREGKEWIARLEEKERKRTGIKSLKLGYNNVFGYYIEVSKSNIRHVPPDYERKQTLTGGERFVTPELKEKERAILSAQERSSLLEHEAFVKIREEVAREGEKVREVARAVATLDVLNALAESAVVSKYVRPVLTDGDGIRIKDGRHPVVEKALSGAFVPNDALMDTSENRLIILTGPNMAGKSTYLRQVALIVLMAQAGSFVPAKEAEIGLVDRIFTRVGAFDDLARGQSTFMVEMTELANILNCATGRSLILLDEVGRGTSTFDGLAIAWAVSEYLYDRGKVGAKTLFATHYHHLTELADSLGGVRNYCMAVREEGSEVVFLRKVVQGRANKSYGIQVARFAGVPEDVISRAEKVLSRIEEENVLEVKAGRKVQRQVLLEPPEERSDIVEELRKLDLKKLTPMEAYVKLNEIKKKLGGPGG
jgi:DNA mismatch repair protein MutS